MFVTVILSNVGQDCDPHEAVDYFQEIAGISTTKAEAEEIGKASVKALYEMNTEHPELNFDYSVTEHQLANG